MCAVAALVAVVGCQNNSERDLIARERRLQEDQIYQLQDYVNQYQQLVCRYRKENCQLRGQLSEGSPTMSQPMTSPTPNDRLRNDSGSVAPEFRSPARSTTPPLKDNPPSEPPPPPADIDVPPLKTSTSNDEVAPRVTPASYEEPIAATHPNTLPSPQSSTSMMVSGEIFANEEGGGPRIAIDVVPPSDAAAELADCKISLMLLSAVNDGRPMNLGRWDFGPDQVRAATNGDAAAPALRFFVELPASVRVDQPTELWARFVPQNGAKLLAHAKVDLAQPGTFASQPSNSPRKQENVVAASYEEPATMPPADVAPPESIDADVVESTAPIAAPIVESSWAIAEPGRPVNLPTLTETGGEGGGWKSSTLPIPPAVQQANNENSRPGSLRESLRRLASKANDTSPPAAAESKPAARPAWSPERGNSDHRVATRPNWSATR